MSIVQGGMGDDQLWGSGEADTLSGQQGNDTLWGNQGDDLLQGGAGDDWMDGGEGADTYLFGLGGGNDTVGPAMPGGPGQPDRLVLGHGIGMGDVALRQEGADLILTLKPTGESVRLLSYMYMPEPDRTQLVFADGGYWDGAAVQRQLYASDDTVMGTPDDDVLEGGLGRDLLWGGLGHDTLHGGAGDDTLDGAEGADTYVFGRGDGQDRVVLFSDPQWQDRLLLGAGIDVGDLVVKDNTMGGLELSVRGSNDRVTLDNYFYGSTPDGVVIAFAQGGQWTSQDVRRQLQWSDDMVYSNAPGGALLEGGLGRDTLMGATGNDTLHGGQGDDLLDGTEGADLYLFGLGDGHDTVMPGMPGGPGQPDRLKLGRGIGMGDVALRLEGQDLIVTLKQSGESVRLTGWQYMPEPDRTQLVFADGGYWDGAAMQRQLVNTDDNLYGTPDNDMLEGGLGRDNLFGAMGRDTLHGGAGDDWMDGGEGADTYLFGLGDGNDTVGPAMPGGPGQPDRLVLGHGIGMGDVALRQEGADLILTLKPTGESVRLLSYLYMPEPDRTQLVFADGGYWDGAAVQRQLYASDDTVMGTPDDDVLEGGLGRDLLWGGLGHDTLHGGAGDDTLDGAEGADTYVFGRGDGQDRVVLFNDPQWQDRLLLGAGIDVGDVVVKDNTMGGLELSVRGSNDRVTLDNYFYGSTPDGVVIAFAQGGQWTSQDVRRQLQWSDDMVYSNAPGGALLEGGLGRDTLMGATGNDTLHGGQGDDLLDGTEGADLYLFGLGDGHDTVMPGMPGGPGQPDRLKLGRGIGMGDVALRLEGQDLIVTLKQSGESVRLTGWQYMPEPDRTQLVFADGGYWDGAAMQRQLVNTDDNLYGTPDNDMLEGGLGRDNLFGAMGRDTLHGGAGDDWMDGGEGADTYLFGLGDGNDTVGPAMPGGPGQPDRLVLGHGIGMGDVALRQEGADLIVTLKPTGESVRLLSYMYMPEPDRTQLVFADGGYWDGAAVQRQLYASDDTVMGTPDDDVLEGGLGRDLLWGGLGHDTLHGGAGDDTLDGAEGADTYIFGRGDGSDTVVSAGYDALAPADTIRFGADITLASLRVVRDQDNLVIGLQDAADQITLAGWFVPTMPRHTMLQFGDGRILHAVELERKLAEGNGSLYGGPDDDVLLGGRGDDLLKGMAGNDYLVGDDGSDTFNGGEGLDTLAGGRGNDVYNLEDIGDVVIEYADGGFDEVYAWYSYTLPENVEYLALQGSADIDATGSDAGVQIWGNAGNNVVTGGAGADELSGNFGGRDTLIGGAGDDLYYVLNQGDIVVEQADGGYDEVKVMVTDHRLADHVESLTLLSNIKAGYGNESDNGLYGNGAANVLEGGGGDDLLSTYGGNDTLTGGKGDDLLSGGTGNDLYHYTVGDGDDYLSNYDTKGNDTLWIHGASQSQIWLRMSGKDLVVSVIGQDGEVQIGSWARGSAYQVDAIRLDNGKTLNVAGATKLVQAMAAFAEPAQTTLPPSYQTALNPVIAANWV
ncbi:MAG: hypothetical protein QM742_13320 [Aquabacterium sp.]